MNENSQRKWWIPFSTEHEQQGGCCALVKKKKKNHINKNIPTLYKRVICGGGTRIYHIRMVPTIRRLSTNKVGKSIVVRHLTRIPPPPFHAKTEEQEGSVTSYSGESSIQVVSKGGSRSYPEVLS